MFFNDIMTRKGASDDKTGLIESMQRFPVRRDNDSYGVCVHVYM